MTLFAFASAASTGLASTNPIPGKIEVFKDWAVGCDNGGDCRATSFTGKESGSFEDWGGPVSIVRTASQDGILRVRVMFTEVNEIDRYQMIVDGKLVDTGPIVKGDYPIEIVGEDAKKVATAIVRGRQLTVTGPGDEILTKISLSGSAAALRYIDQKQNRTYTRTALVAKGRRTFKPVHVEIPVVPVSRWTKSERIPATTEIVNLVENSKCKEDRFGVVEDQVYPIGQKDGTYRALILMACGSGAYNFSSAAYIGEIIGSEADGASWTFTPAKFDIQPAWGGEGRLPLLVNAFWDETDQTLGSYAKGRGLGDCGSAENYVWDGAQFRLIEASNMPECRGAYEWITTWRASYRDVKPTKEPETPTGG